MRQILVYADSLSWGIVPNTRRRLAFEERWPGVLEHQLNSRGRAQVRIIEDCMNGRRTAWDDPYKPGRNGLASIQERIEINSPLALVIVMLGTNDFQSMHLNNAWTSAQGVLAIITAIRCAPIEPGMPVPHVMIVAPPIIGTPRGPIAPKFAGAKAKCLGLADELKSVARQADCHFVDAGTIIACSKVDGVHLDAEDHVALGKAIAEILPRVYGWK
jgi:lysophospholipase L1-like esterase